MKINKYKKLEEARNDLISKGFTYSFEFNKEGLFCLENQKIYCPEEIKIVEYHRFAGAESSDESVLLFVMEVDEKIKGLFVMTYGTYYNLNLIDFISKVKIIPRENK